MDMGQARSPVGMLGFWRGIATRIARFVGHIIRDVVSHQGAVFPVLAEADAVSRLQVA